jgi:hypothetical protein
MRRTAGSLTAGASAVRRLCSSPPAGLDIALFVAVRRAYGRRVRVVIVALAWLSGAACSQEARLQQHREKFESLSATTAAIAEAWLAGSTSTTYTTTALEQTYQLVEKERQALAAKPDALGDPRGAELSRAAEQLARLLAAMLQNVRAGDAASVRARLGAIPIALSRTRRS